MIPLQTGASHPVSHLVFSPDGGTVAVAQPHYGVTILERATGRTVAVCTLVRRALLTGLAFCGEGKYLAAAHAKGVEVFDAGTGAAVAVSFRPMLKGLQLADRPDGLFGFGFYTGGIVWRPAAPDALDADLDPLSNGKNHHMWLSPDARFAVGHWSGTRKRLIDVAAERFAAEFEISEDADPKRLIGAKFCPLSRRFAVSDGHAIRVFDTRDLEPGEGEAPRPSNRTAWLEPVFALPPDRAAEAGTWDPPFALAADGRGVFVKRPRNRVQLWDAPTGTLTNEWSWQFEWVTCVAASADHTTAVAGGRFGRVLLWDLE